eukprot:GHVU01196317.1.p1 GENE.GHVU01196317.1~~GHVU01196317.1.p1  ORF type:complete len:378 (+),score=46.74 GHVU01196317.1:906-2039(+)
MRSAPRFPPAKAGGSVTVRDATAGQTAGKAAGRDRRRKDWHKTAVRMTVQATRELPPGVKPPAGKTLSTHWNQQLENESTAGHEYNTLHVELSGALRGVFDVQVGEFVGSLRALFGLNFTNNYNKLTNAEKDRFVRQQVEILCKSILRLRKIATCFKGPAPPVLPGDFKAQSPADFVGLLKGHHAKLVLAYGEGYDDKREQIIDEHQRLVRDAAVQQTQSGTASATFDGRWRRHKEKYPLLHRLAQGLATVYPGNADVERDFALLKWLFSPLRSCMTVSSIVGSMMCRQLEGLRDLATRQGTVPRRPEQATGTAAQRDGDGGEGACRGVSAQRRGQGMLPAAQPQRGGSAVSHGVAARAAAVPVGTRDGDDRVGLHD